MKNFGCKMIGHIYLAYEGIMLHAGNALVNVGDILHSHKLKQIGLNMYLKSMRDLIDMYYQVDNKCHEITLEMIKMYNMLVTDERIRRNYRLNY